MTVLYWSDEHPVSRDYVLELSRRYSGMRAQDMLRAAILEDLPGKIALVSSFGTEAAVLLHMVAQIDRDVPVIFIDTAKLFEQTLAYRDQLIDRLGLQDVRTVLPLDSDLACEDPRSDLWQVDPDGCCHIRKVRPLRRALEGFYGWISGRKRYHGFERANLPLVELSAGQIKLNPLAEWQQSDLMAYMTEHDLPPHPLVMQGYTSVGCACCTSKPVCADQPRSGRWAGDNKTECGIHFATDGTLRRVIGSCDEA